MITCPSCSSSRTLIHLDSARRGRCLRCGAGWIQEGAWQHSITRPRDDRGLRAVADIPVQEGMSGLDLAMAVVGELQRSHGAEVTGHDVVDGVSEISLRMRVPLARRFEAQREQYAG